MKGFVFALCLAVSGSVPALEVIRDADEQTFAGSVKVKLGPIALVYNGSGTFVEKDEAAHRFVVDAKGKDKRGNGTAGAKVTLSMAPSASGGTDVEVLTDLAVTGKPAQFGRGVMQDVSDKLLGQFVACLEQRLGESPTPDVPPAGMVGDETPVEHTVPPAEPSRTTPPAPSDPDPLPAPETGTGAASTPSVTPPQMPPATPPAAPPAKADDAINLGSTVLPILFKSYWKQGLAALVVVAIIIWLIVR